MPPHKRLAAGGTRVMLYDYMDEWGGENVTDTAGVTDALYSQSSGAFYTVSKRTVKAWNAGTGQLFKVLRDVARNEITAACLADNGRKLYLGDACGKVCAHGLSNGRLLTEFDAHSVDISCLAIWKGTNRIISADWDGTVKVHSDECTRVPQMKAVFQNHRDGVTCIAVSPQLLLLASGGTDMQVNLYDLRTLKHEHALARFHHVISSLDFMPSRCLLAVADQGGTVSLWRTRPHHDKWTCIYHFRNMPQGLPGAVPAGGEVQRSQPIAVTALRFYSQDENDADGGMAWIYTADAKGSLRCWDFTILCERRGIHEADLKDLFSKQRTEQLQAAANIHRGTMLGDMPMPPRHNASPPALTAPPAAERGAAPAQSGGGAFLTGVEDTGDDEEGKGGQPHLSTVRSAVQAVGERSQPHASGGHGAVHPDAEAEVALIFEAEGHQDSVLSMYVTHEPNSLVTCGLDRRVRAWDEDLKEFGTLLQSRDRAFKFPYDPHFAHQRQLEEAENLLQQIGPAPRLGRLPALATRGAEDVHQMLLELGSGTGKKRPKPKKGGEAGWRFAADQVIADPDADEEDYQILFEQMERAGGKDGNGDAAVERVEDRLLRRAHVKHAGQMKTRATNLSGPEAEAAARLAKAMGALGGDEFGTYASMARSLRPSKYGGTFDGSPFDSRACSPNEATSSDPD
eukprot:gnl/TRDRNA2_/TRDRNA2_145337_c0_seq1.p1 gnl/TRDRNA2_/TRDRNA2_145337_c0~~gnl/TRDRNA2_/TRDRNA2_145337_c0_seq1.p1  ORF type:complete len:691 (+),score=121.89 gnl/TRDRNA2_/TRDRNA2_145337_c0_seq1:22-2073(+)